MASSSTLTGNPACTRRAGLTFGGASLLALFDSARAQSSAEGFLDEAFRLRDDAVAAGDQPYGAVVVLDGRIIGRGRSRVVSDRNIDHHAERLAARDAQLQLGRQDLSRAVIYSTAIPCGVCQPALAQAGIARMIHGRAATDAGAPRAGG
jgi:tRNA(Arg) A34 adenosine deaminase TadA